MTPAGKYIYVSEVTSFGTAKRFTWNAVGNLQAATFFQPEPGRRSSQVSMLEWVMINVPGAIQVPATLRVEVLLGHTSKGGSDESQDSHQPD